MADRDLIPVYVKTLTGATQRIWVRKYEPWSTIRWPIACMGIPHTQQRHIYCGFQMEPDRTFADYNVQEEAVIHVVMRLRGAAGNNANIYMDKPKKVEKSPIGIQLDKLGARQRLDRPSSLKEAWHFWINYDETQYMTEAPVIKKKKDKPLPKDWEKKARKVLPETLQILGYDQRNIDLVIKTLDPVDASVAVAWLNKNRIIDKMLDLSPLFEKYPDIVSEHILKHFTLTERIELSTVSKSFNKMTRSPLAWKNLVLMRDWVDMTDKSFTKIMKTYGHLIERLAIQRCCYLTPKGAMLIGDHCANLKVLFAGDCPAMTAKAIEYIFSKCLKLEVVDLRFQTNDVEFPVEKVPSVKKLQNLRELNLSNRVYAENSEISSSSLKILNITNSFTEGGYNSLKLDCPNLTHLLTSDDKHKVSNSLKKTVSVNQPLQGITVYAYYGAGYGDFFTPKVMTNAELQRAHAYTGDLENGTTLWVSY